MTKFRIGRHINITFGFTSAVAYAASINCNIMQIFLGPPQKVSSKAKSKTELTEFGAELKKYKMKMVIHGSYAINLCHEKKSKRLITSVKALVQDLNASAIIGPRCLGVIIHMGKNIAANNISDKKAIMNYTMGLKTALAQTPDDTTIILEMGASQGTEVASKIEGLHEIYWNLTETERSRIKFCVDTCHIWATGYDISNRAGIKEFFKEFSDQIGLEKIVLIHFNDSKTPLASHVDRHADLGHGFIGTVGLKTFAQYAMKYKIPIIMETPLDATNPHTNMNVTFTEELAKVKLWLKK
jgi:apurinic endonuclease APN1